MARVYLGQTALRIRINTGVDLTGATTLQAAVKKPSGAGVLWDCSGEAPLTAGIMYHDVVTASELDEAGQFTLQSYVVFSDGRWAYGDEAFMIVHPISSV